MKSFSRKSKIFFSNTNLGLIFSLLLLITGSVFIYKYTCKKVSSFLTSQTQQKARLAASSGANSIEIFLKVAQNSLILLSKDSSVINMNSQTQKTIDDFVKDWKGTPIMGVARYDSNGEIRFLSNNIGETIDLTDNPKIFNKNLSTWAQDNQEGDVLFGKPLIPKVKLSNPQYIFPFATPIYKNGQYDGALALGISLSKIVETYLTPLKVTPNYRVYLIHPDSTILASSPEHMELIGVNYLEYLKNNPYKGSQRAIQEFGKAVKSDIEGETDLILYSITQKEPIEFMIAYSPIHYHDEHLTLGLAVPFSDIYQANPGFLKETKIVILGFFIYTITTLSLIILLIVRKRIKNYPNNLPKKIPMKKKIKKN